MNYCSVDRETCLRIKTFYLSSFLKFINKKINSSVLKFFGNMIEVSNAISGTAAHVLDITQAKKMKGIETRFEHGTTLMAKMSISL